MKGPCEILTSEMFEIVSQLPIYLKAGCCMILLLLNIVVEVYAEFDFIHSFK